MKLHELSLSELWELFPIFLTEHQECWSVWYEEESSLLCEILHDIYDNIHHIGSTAIPGIYAKPIIDILIEFPNSASMIRAKELLVKHNYICMAEQGNRISLNKGYMEYGYAEKVFHIHLRLTNDNDEVYFRDYLLCHPQTAHEYEALKKLLLPKFKNDRDGYTDAKSDFVQRVTALAIHEMRIQNRGGKER